MRAYESRSVRNGKHAMQENQTDSALIEGMYDLTEHAERLVDGFRFCHSGRIITGKLYRL